jgi:hypothetical protein
MQQQITEATIVTSDRGGAGPALRRPSRTKRKKGPARIAARDPPERFSSW